MPQGTSGRNTVKVLVDEEDDEGGPVHRPITDCAASSHVKIARLDDPGKIEGGWTQGR
jgi:hypothetical protein